ncbi:MAG: hypothetical protein UT15_C0003G0041 [Berkelbacteria bacterium GW2011_GWA1_39_10]|uniref:Prolow-density lipoprotein receptor-related protein 1-like beta-propeller domain-containing protein n=1 Tax=Berkelbacteria bacterium GW2011_GWA1_39_10 TaxID=1618332 RepID=A0A0G0PNG8_9BACT|nr:MAG: hypothetical protein UT15_C0003G0041 [Berkelbacteria bacterium GW2011_GWA1_39_10]
MKKISWVLFISYLVVFTGVGVFIYFKIIDKYFTTGAESIEPEKTSQTGYIYYSQESNLFRINPALDVDLATQRIERFQSTGAVNNLSVNKNGQKIAYDSKENNSWEIWQVDLSSNQSEKIVSLNSDLKNYTDFIKPKYSPGGAKLAYIGKTSDEDFIFIMNLATGLSYPLEDQFKAKITDYSWSNDGDKIVYCLAETGSSCWTINIDSQNVGKLIDGKISQISWDKTDKIYYIQQKDSANIFSVKENGKEITQISAVALPKKVTSFEIDQDGIKMVYEVMDNANSDVYTAKLDGGDTIQITSDNISRQPIISNNGSAVAFLKPKEGIYSFNLQNMLEKKIVNIIDEIKLLSWR